MGRSQLLITGIAIVALAAPAAEGNLLPNQPIQILGTVIGALGANREGLVNWGSQANPLPGSDNGSPHLFGQTSVYHDDVFGVSFSVTVTSSAIPPLPGTTWGGQIIIDFSGFVASDFWSPPPSPASPPAPGTDLGFFNVDIPLVKSPNNLDSIKQIFVNQGNVVSDGMSISWDSSVGQGINLDPSHGGNPIVEITWYQIPTSGSLTVLALAFGAACCRRSSRG